MRQRTDLAAGVALALAVSLLAACSDASSDDDAGGDPVAGGTLKVLAVYPLGYDPQRVYTGVQLEWYRRLLYRGLLAFPMSEDPVVATTPVPDLATDIGTSSEGGAVWEFTLKDGVTWEDGSEITCEDVQYGTSRVFANDVITGGPNYTLSYLDVEDYPGPYVATDEQQAAFEDAVGCDGRTITFRFNKPWQDFPLAVAGMMMTDPYKESFDEGAKSEWKSLSNGPYRVEGGEWSERGATLVRNEEYDASTDDPRLLRRALPDRIEFDVVASQTGGELINDRLIANSPDVRNAITTTFVAASQLPGITGDVEDRFASVPSPINSYLAPNFNRATMQDATVRRALAMSTDLNGYLTAIGGDRAAVASETIVNPSIPGSRDNPAFAKDGGNEGDPEGARALLEEAGVELPVRITVGFVATPANNKAMAVLKETWDRAGFAVSLEGETQDTYYGHIARPDDAFDVTFASWAADWPSMMTVLPPLFDSRPNFSATSCGENYGCYRSADFEALVDEAASASSVEEQTSVLQEADLLLGEDVAYIPLETFRFNWVHGSEVVGFTTSPAGLPEIGLIGVDH